MVLSSKFEQLREGDTFVTGGRTVTEADVLSFAAQTGVSHPQHVDPEWTAPTGPSGLVAPGLLTLSFAFGLVRADPDCAVGLRAMTDVVFTRPVKVGDTLTVNGRVASLAPLSVDAGVVGMTLLAANQHQKTVCRARLQLLWRRDLSAVVTEKAG